MALQEEMEIQGNWLFKRRGTLPLIIIVIGLTEYLFNKYYAQNVLLRDDWREDMYEIICLIVSVLGHFIRIYTVGYTPPNTSGRNINGQLADSLNTKGIYSILRHPLYLGNFFMWLGIAMLTADLWFIMAFILLYWLYYERIMFAEEQFLRKKYGEEYLQWANSTPAIIPSFTSFEKTAFVFSWKKVLRQEKNGAAALFTLFFIFDLLGELVIYSSSFNMILLLGCIISLMTYLVLKYLKYNTNLLADTRR